MTQGTFIIENNIFNNITAEVLSNNVINRNHIRRVSTNIRIIASSSEEAMRIFNALLTARNNGRFRCDLILIDGSTREITVEDADFNDENNFIVIKTPTLVRL